jgi:DNA-binding CsgD family transcriptional regulator
MKKNVTNPDQINMFQAGPPLSTQKEPVLTDNHKQIIDWCEEGLSLEDIANKKNTTLKTVKDTIKRITDKGIDLKTVNKIKKKSKKTKPDVKLLWSSSDRPIPRIIDDVPEEPLKSISGKITIITFPKISFEGMSIEAGTQVITCEGTVDEKLLKHLLNKGDSE